MIFGVNYSCHKAMSYTKMTGHKVESEQTIQPTPRLLTFYYNYIILVNICAR